MKKKLGRLFSLSAVVALCFSFLCVPASAEELSGSADIYICANESTSLVTVPGGSATAFSTAYPYSSGYFDADVAAYKSKPYGAFCINALNVPLQNVTGNVIVSFSYYLGVIWTSGGEENTFSFSTISSPTATMQYTNHLDQTGSGNVDKIYSFATGRGEQSKGGWASQGLSTTCTFYGTELEPISNLKILWPNSTYYANMHSTIGSSSTTKIPEGRVYITSFRVISSGVSSAELGELENIASEIAASNDILNAMYGDILAVCNSIYSRLGDMLFAQQVANEYFQSIIPLIGNISTNTANIYNILGTYFDRVLAAIDNQTLTLEEAIQDAEAALELYLKPMIDYFKELEETTGESASSLPSHKTDLDGFANANTGIDSDAQTGLAAILPVFTAFSFMFSILGIFIGLGLFMLIIRKGLS